VSTPQTYRYVVGGTTRQTNQYGADVLRQAVNNGYEQGFRAGQADRADRRRASYRTSFGYQDANFGYGGSYVDQSDYNYYFRAGFRRGYDDGYNSRSQYGTSSNGAPSILGSLLTSILGLQPIQ
jgi:flagellar biosynthesis/type III secretory pathway protein FliH